jgi:hypothetical protein
VVVAGAYSSGMAADWAVEVVVGPGGLPCPVVAPAEGSVLPALGRVSVEILVALLVPSRVPPFEPERQQGSGPSSFAAELAAVVVGVVVGGLPRHSADFGLAEPVLAVSSQGRPIWLAYSARRLPEGELVRSNCASAFCELTRSGDCAKQLLSSWMPNAAARFMSAGCAMARLILVMLQASQQCTSRG